MTIIYGDASDNFLEGSPWSDRLIGLRGNDELSGLGGPDILDGGDGNDSLRGGFGDDTLIGGSGDDWMYSEPGDDTFYAGDGFDRASYQDAPGPVLLNLMTGIGTDGTGGTDRFFGLERLIGSAFDDVLIGDESDNSFSGELGDDTITGNGGFDYLWYGRSPDAILVDLEAGTVTGGEGTDVVSGIEGVGGSNFGDTILGDAGDNYFEPDQGGDQYTPNYLNGAADLVDGRGGWDIVSYQNAVAAVRVDLAAETATDGQGNTDTIIAIEEVQGSDFGDALSGSGEVDWLRGGAGNDSLLGRDGDDALFGDTGNDALFGGTGNDLLDGSAGRDSLGGGDGHDTLDGGGWADRMFGSDGDDLLRGGKGDDTIAGGPGADVILGGDGSDHVFASPGDDIVFGGAGSDTLWGGAGDDTLGGGGWADTFVFGARNQGRDIVRDFSDGVDQLQIFGSPGFDDLTISAEGQESTSIAYGGGIIVLDGILPGQLGSDDLILV